MAAKSVLIPLLPGFEEHLEGAEYQEDRVVVDGTLVCGAEAEQLNEQRMLVRR